MTFTHLDLFAGIGGFSRAVQWLGGTTVGFVEWDSWNRRVLAKHWPEAQFHGDIRTLTADTLRSWGIRVHDGHTLADSTDNGRHRRSVSGENRPSRGAVEGGGAVGIDLLTGGYPCQPFSHAGKRLGAADDRHLWPEMRRVIDLTRPRYVLAENVAGHVTMGLDTVLAELEADGYACGAVVVPACACNALHRRDRVWIMAHASEGGRGAEQRNVLPGQSNAFGRGTTSTGVMGHADGAGLEGRQQRRERAGERIAGPTGGEPGDTDANSVGLVQRQERNVEAPGRLEAPRGDNALRHGASSPRTGIETPRTVDPRPDGIRAGLVRRPATRSAWDDPDVIRAMWADGSWELDLPRVVAREAERRQKLQAAGNAIVPIVAYEILQVMIGDAP